MGDTAFIFDIGNVMLDFDLPGLVGKISTASNASDDLLLNNWYNQDLIDVETGKIDPYKYYYSFSKKIGLTWSYDCWIDNWAAIYKINEFGRNLFLKLRERYSVYILSNLAEFHVAAIRKKFPDFFDYSNKNLFSFDLGYHKPDKNIYLKACEIIGFRPSDCIFLDDSLENVLEARNVGLGAFHFTPENYTMINRLVIEYIAGKNIIGTYSRET